jgi:hypothetical protein
MRYKEDLEILEDYKDGAPIKNSDSQKINELASIGLMYKTLNFMPKSKTFQMFAKTSQLGIALLPHKSTHSDPLESTKL